MRGGVSAAAAALLALAARRAGAAPPPPDTYDSDPPRDTKSELNDELVSILIILGALLLIGLIALLCYVAALYKRLGTGMQDEKDKDAHVQQLLDARNQAEGEVVDKLADRMQTLQKDFQHAHNVHAKFIKDHDPVRFEEMRQRGEIEVEGDSVDSLQSSSENTDEWLEDELDAEGEVIVPGNPPRVVKAHEMGIFDPDDPSYDENARKIKKQEREFVKEQKRLKRGIRDMKKQREQRNKELDLEFERLKLEQRLVDLDHQEKSDELKRLERKQREQEQLDNVKASHLFVFGDDDRREVVRGRGIPSGQYDVAYDSDEDFDDDAPDLPDHLDDLSPKGVLLKRRMIEMRGRLDKEKGANKQRQMAMERDMALMRLRLQQQRKRQERQKRRAGAGAGAGPAAPGGLSPPNRRRGTGLGAHTGPGTSTRAPLGGGTTDPSLSGDGHTARPPQYDHRPVPRWITSPWAVDGVTQDAGGRGGTRASPPHRAGMPPGGGSVLRGDRSAHPPPPGHPLHGRRGGAGAAGAGAGQASRVMLDYVAAAVQDPAAQREALQAGRYTAEHAASPLEHGLPHEAMPTGAIPPHVRAKRRVL